MHGSRSKIIHLSTCSKVFLVQLIRAACKQVGRKEGIHGKLEYGTLWQTPSLKSEDVIE
jgi:hypothetical protein